MLDELRERVLSLHVQDPQRAEIPQVNLKLQGHSLEMEVEIHASEILAVPLPGKLPCLSPLSVGYAVTLRHDGCLWGLSKPSVQRVKIEGLIPHGAEWQWSFLLNPRLVQINAAYDPKDFFHVVRLKRELELGLIWQVRTKVKYLSPTGKAISLSVCHCSPPSV